jgi:hypothetical protein
LRYHLARPVGEAFPARLAEPAAGLAVSVTDVRAILPLASVTFHARDDRDTVLVAGAVGLTYVTVTYARADDLAERMARTEQLLACRL